jgi:hypothetical protein
VRCPRVLTGFTLENRGRRECRVRAAPAVSCAMESGVRARAYRLSGGIRHPLRDGFTAYAVLSSATNSFCHRRLRIGICLSPVGPAHLRKLDISNGCQDHTVLPYAKNVVRPARLHIAHEVQPALRPYLRADALASTTSHPAFVTTRDRPSCRNGMAGDRPLIWGFGEAEFCPSCQFVARRRASACKHLQRALSRR